jgi:NAD(P)-dependent dehydrogenase (short-subunit alcohol dehydrogenase family)
MTRRIEGKVAIVFGAGQTAGSTVGNGRACAITYARAGAMVACVDLDLASAKETQLMIEQEGGTAIAMQADVTREADCQAAIAICADTFGKIDILHNNVGAAPGDSMDVVNLSEPAIDEVIALNFKSVIFTSKHALPYMRKQQDGCIINISSIAAICSTLPVLYRTTKLAVNGLTQQMAIANAEDGIRVNAIMPGLMDTPVAIEEMAKRRNVDPEEIRQLRHEQVPLRRKMGTAWDVANAALFLASDDAAFITGVILAVDGGHSIRVG